MYGSGRPKKKLSTDELMKWELKLQKKEKKLKEREAKLKQSKPNTTKTKTPNYMEQNVEKYDNFQIVPHHNQFHSIFKDLEAISMPKIISYPMFHEVQQQQRQKPVTKKYYKSVNAHTINNKEAMVEINENGKVKRIVVPLNRLNEFL